MKFKYLALLSILVTLMLAGCGGPSSVAVAPAADLETLDLADTVDVSTVAAVKDRGDVLVLDVREQWEYDEGHIPGVTLLPMGEVPGRLNEIPTDKSVIVTCRTGNRSGQVVDFLRQNGYDNVHNMSGGIVAWEQAGYEIVR